jgi:hypothetical protein
VSGVLFAIDNIPDECFTWVPPPTIEKSLSPFAGDKDLVYKTVEVAKHRYEALSY